MKPPVHDASARQHSGEPSSGLGPNDGRKDRLQNPDRAELEFCEIAGLAAGYDANKAPVHDTAWIYRSTTAAVMGTLPH
jgi:hypothetical protein